MNSPTRIDLSVPAAWGLDPTTVRPLGTGLINRTYLACTPEGTPRVLQQLNPMFRPEVNEDIEAVTAHLEARGLLTPRLLRTRAGRLCLPAEGGSWRVMTFIPGRVLDAVEVAAEAAGAGYLLARFHRALDDLDYRFRHRRPPVHEPARHLAALAEALATHSAHRLHAPARILADEIFAAARALPPLPETPLRVVHGDPKISNLVFAKDGPEALCLLDLDTLGPMRLPFELGDALRSWCSVSSEDEPAGQFCALRFAAAVEGYAEAAAGWWTADERRAILPATATIQVELAARFCADSLNESYFGWNADRFPGRGEHNMARARGQLALHRALLDQWDTLAAAVPASG